MVIGLIFQTYDSHAEYNVMAPEEVFAFGLDLENIADYDRAATEFLRYVSFAERHAKSATEFPKLEESLYRAAINLARAGKTDTALKLFAQFGARFPDSRWIDSGLYRLSVIYENAGALNMAKQRLEQLIQRNHSTQLTDQARFRLAWLLLKQENLASARQQLQSVIDPDLTDKAILFQQAVDELEKQPKKNPRLAGLLSALVPGAGHLYLNRPKDAVFTFFSNGLLIGGTLQAFQNGISALGIVLGILEIGWYSGSIYSSVSLAHQQNQHAVDGALDHMSGYLTSPERLNEFHIQFKAAEF
ncbi:MAG: tetratricopeptide repeat protein [Magnetococcales bacterium]|nr:tetratricopeptide repeat protein [Magnetococcales bacterium]